MGAGHVDVGDLRWVLHPVDGLEKQAARHVDVRAPGEIEQLYLHQAHLPPDWRLAIPKLGTSLPIVGRRLAGSASRKVPRRSDRGPQRRGLADALFTDTQQRVLGLLFGQPDRSFMLSELIRLARTGTGAVQRELQRLSETGVVTVELVAGRKYLQANRASPIFGELRALVEKTTGVAAELRKALDRESSRIRFAVLFGSVAKRTDRSASDIDVLLVSDDLTQEEAFALFEETEKRLGRRISPIIYTPGEFRKKQREENPFLTKVMAGEHVVLAESEDAEVETRVMALGPLP